MSDTEISRDSTASILLTPEGYHELKEEFELLVAVKRPEIAERIRESQQHGEFSEDNSELDEVKFEQAMVESRISELKALFASAQVLETEAIPTDQVGIGSRVTVQDLTYGDEFEVRLVSSFESNPAEDLISNESPMGLAISGKKTSDEVSFDAPEGLKRYKIVSIGR